MKFKSLLLSSSLSLILFSSVSFAECDRSRFGERELHAQKIIDKTESQFLNDEGMISRISALKEIEKNATCELVEYKTNIRTTNINFVDVCVKVRFRCLSIGDKCFNQTEIQCSDETGERTYKVDSFWNRKTNEIQYLSETAVLKQ